jgi:hypothetical protein
MRASSSSAAVDDSSARPGRPAASREASTTIRRLETPGRTPTTVSRSAPSHSVVERVTSNAGRLVLRSRTPSVSATRSASRASPLEPAARSGKVRASSLSELRCGRAGSPKAEPESNASALSPVVVGAGRSASENAATNTAISAGRNAAR